MKTRKNRTKIDALYWINLDRSTERRDNMEKLLKDSTFNGIKKHRVQAIDGNEITKHGLRLFFKNMKQNSNIKEHCCLLSHLNALYEFSNSPYTIALIVEDDLSLEYKPYWKQSIQSCIQNAPKDWEILQLSYIIIDKLPTKLYTNVNETHYAGTAAYLVHKKGVRRFIKNVYKDKFILDHISPVSDHFIYKKMNTYTYKYPYFTYTSIDSTIHPDHIDTIHIPSKNSIFDKFYDKPKIME